MSSYRVENLAGIFYYKIGTTGCLHREDGPAEEYSHGTKCWYIDGNFHREDGPAIQFPNGKKIWFYRGEKIDCKSQETFERIIKLKAFW